MFEKVVSFSYRLVFMYVVVISIGMKILNVCRLIMLCRKIVIRVVSGNIRKILIIFFGRLVSFIRCVVLKWFRMGLFFLNLNRVGDWLIGEIVK